MIFKPATFPKNTTLQRYHYHQSLVTGVIWKAKASLSFSVRVSTPSPPRKFGESQRVLDLNTECRCVVSFTLQPFNIAESVLSILRIEGCVDFRARLDTMVEERKNFFPPKDQNPSIHLVAGHTVAPHLLALTSRCAAEDS